MDNRFETLDLETTNVESRKEAIGDAGLRPDIPAKCHTCKRSVGIVNIGGNVLLVLVKAYLGIIGGSKGLFADAIHSLGDLVASVLMVIALAVSGKPKSEKFQYGFGKFEFIIAVIIYASLVVIGFYILVDGIYIIYVGSLAPPHIVTAWGALISVVANEVMYRQGLCISERFNNPSILAKAIESRVDVYSSIAVLIGILAARIGFFALDAAAAIAVAILILKSAFEMLIKSIKGLMDSSLESKDLQRIQSAVESIPEIRKVGKIRSREIGSSAEVEITVYVDRSVKVNDFGEIRSNVSRKIRAELEFDGEVNVFIKTYAEGEI